MSWLSGISAIASSVGNLAGQTGWLSYSAQKSLNKTTAQQNADISLGASRSLSEEGPSWTVAGLRQAGINPILAATNGNLGATTANISGSASSGSGGSLGNPVTAYLEAKNLQKQNEVLTNTAKNLNANSAKLESDAALNAAKRKNVEADTFNKEHGTTGIYSIGNLGIRTLYKTPDDVKSFFGWSKEKAKSLKEKARQIIDASSNSAKSNDAKLNLRKGDFEIESYLQKQPWESQEQYILRLKQDTRKRLGRPF